MRTGDSPFSLLRFFYCVFLHSDHGKTDPFTIRVDKFNQGQLQGNEIQLEAG
jgi:hypothetical protein